MYYAPQSSFAIQAAKAQGDCFGYDQTDMGQAKVSELMQNTKFSSELKHPSAVSKVSQPILINAPTGAGKTSFIREYLAPFAQEQGWSVLFLSNRYALNMQMKKIISQDIDSPAFSSGVINAIHRYGNLIIGTYQSIDGIISMLRNPAHNISPVEYVVLDEAHFFTSDALFNAETCNIFRKILYYLPTSQRIYLSATPQEVKDIIAYEEHKLYQFWLSSNKNNLHHLVTELHPITSISEYLFQPDYTYIKLNFCDELEDLVSKIISSEDKWLIFVSSKSDGEELEKTLKKDLKDNVYYIDADIRATDPGYRKLSIMNEYEQFSGKVLISTSLLDTGINFRDKKLKHIVVDSLDPIQIKQMIGRKRRDDNSEHQSETSCETTEAVNVYIVKHSQKEIQSYLKGARDKVALLDYYGKNPQRFIQEKYPNLTEAERGLFQPTQNPLSREFTFVVNQYAPYKLACMIRHYEYLDGLLEMEGEGALECEIAGWFDIEDGGWINVEDVLSQIREQAVVAINQYKPAPAATDSKELKNLDLQLWKLVQPIAGKRKIKHDTQSVGKGENIRKIMQALSLPYDIKKEGNVWTIIDEEPPEMPA